MTKMFDETLVETHDLYHLRYGRGAVIVAIQRGEGETRLTRREDTPDNKRAKHHQHVAALYNERQVGEFSSAPTFEPILSIQEEASVVRIVVQVKYTEHVNMSWQSPGPMSILTSATIERVIPLDQVTLEIVRTAERSER